MRKDMHNPENPDTARPGWRTILGGTVVLLLLVILGYVGYQILHLLNPPNTYETVLTATVEDVQEGYTRSTVRARLRVSEVNGEPAAFCCQCDGLPLSRAGPGTSAGSAGWARAPASAPGRPGCRAASARRCARGWKGTKPAPWRP